MNDLNTSARVLLKKSGHISKEDFIYTIAKTVENDFGKKQTIKEEKSFSKGDRIVFTQNNTGLGVKNGTMGTITNLDQQTLQVKLDGEHSKEVSFSPHLNPHFDQGWAITIHKSQGMTVDRTYVLASSGMTQNLTYVAMTRHRENVQVFGSNLEFSRPDKLPEVLSKSGEKLLATDYLDSVSLDKLMQKKDHLLTKIFNRVSNEMEAVGAVSKKALSKVTDYFLGTNRDKEIKVDSGVVKEAVREETRAEIILKSKEKSDLILASSLAHLEKFTQEKRQEHNPQQNKTALSKDSLRPHQQETLQQKKTEISYTSPYADLYKIRVPQSLKKLQNQKQIEKEHDELEMEWER